MVRMMALRTIQHTRMTYFKVTSLDDVKTSQQADTNAAKTMALDHLGVIAARLRSSAIRVRQRGGKDPIVALDEVLASRGLF